MISNAELRMRIAHRAYGQFNRDVKQVINLIENAGGSISIYDVMDKVQAEEKEELRHLKLLKVPVLSKFVKPREENDEIQVYEFLLRFMSDLKTYELNLEKLSEVNFRELYTKQYKKDYEEQQMFLYRTRDMRFYNNARSFICGAQTTESAEM